MDIRLDDLSGAEIRALLEAHLAQMHAQSPACSVHALDLSGLKKPEISFYSGWLNGQLIACGAIKQLDARHAELKSMRTPAASRRTGAGRAMLAHLVAVARERGCERLSLETGSQDAFIPARTLYASFGFVESAPFADYAEDPNSCFMTLAL